jgi:outer membrane protein assembly factor BamB
VINKYGNGKAVRLSDRKVLWELNIRPSDKGKPNFVTAPVYYEGRIYGAFLTGHLAAGDAETGKKDWVRKFDAHLESSPLAVDGKLYLGTDTTNLLALDAASGKTLWTYNAPGAIKASPSYDDGNVFFADYQSSMFALEADSGKLVWSSNTSKVPPYGRGGFFSSPAATVIGHTVYTSSFKTQETTGLDVRTHERTFHLKEAGYTPMVSDGERLFLIGYYELIGLEPR